MRKLSGSLGVLLVVLLSGCSAGYLSKITYGPAPVVQGLQGVVHGGQPPVAGATIKLWAAGTSGDGSTGSLLASTATDSNGNFTLGTYTCPGSDPYVYLTATGGNPGLTAGTNNTAISMLAALTDCNTLKANTPPIFVFVDEVTTMGAVAALHPYMTSSGGLGSGSGDAAAFATAFVSVAEYTNTTTGTAPGSNLPAGYYASSTEINTLGNIIASCINTTGGFAGDGGSACGTLFTLTTVGSVAPTTTLGAMLNIINNPTQNASALFNLASAVTPFQPVDSVAPSSWTLPIEQMAATPTFSTGTGTYSSAQFVTLSDGTSGAVIYYTLDGSTPTNASLVYNGSQGAITVSSSETLNAIAEASGYGPSAVASASYTITGSTATYNVGGAVSLTDGCGGATPPVTVTLSQGSTLIQTTTTTNGNGSFTFSGVPNGTYTVTPSISGPSSLFYPASQSVSVGDNNVTNANFSANLGYTVTGTVSYRGSTTGQIYLSLNPTPSCGGGTVGTSISSKGAFTIHGVPPGAYTLAAYMDNLGTGIPNASNPTGNNTSVTVSPGNYSGANITLGDPSTVTITSAPTITGMSGFNTGFVAQYNPIKSNSIEQASSYTLQWSSTLSPFTVAGSHTFTANGNQADAWFLNGFTDTNVYYFRAYGSSAGTAVGPYSAIYGPVTIGAPTGGISVSGNVTFSQTPTGPLYVGFLSSTNGNFYAEYIGSPVSSQFYSIQAPADTYEFFAILDQNHDGLIDAGDIQDATDNGSSSQTVVISGPGPASESLTLPKGSATATVQTQNNNSISSGGSSQSYDLSFKINGLAKLPVAVQLTSGPNLINPVDIAACTGGNGCGQGFEISFGIGTTVPNVGDTYTFGVTYSDTTTGTLSAAVTGVLNAFATNLAPQTGGGSSTTPTFSWTYPTSASSYVYLFSLCCSNNSDVWDIPGNNSNANGFTSAQIPLGQIPWNTDPTGGGSSPSIGSLSTSTNYSWQIEVQDSNGNSAQTQVQYQP